MPPFRVRLVHVRGFLPFHSPLPLHFPLTPSSLLQRVHAALFRRACALCCPPLRPFFRCFCPGIERGVACFLRRGGGGRGRDGGFGFLFLFRLRDAAVFGAFEAEGAACCWGEVVVFGHGCGG